MEGTEMIMALPEVLVERIIAAMPFPYIFKARCLSKSWLARLSPIASLDDEATKRLAVSFQRQVLERSKHWGTFYPVYIDDACSLAFNRASQSWQKMAHVDCVFWERVEFSQVQIIGALVLFPMWPTDKLSCIRGAREGNPPQRKDLFVANILTGSWKQLPPRPQLPRGHFAVSRREDYGETLVSDTSLGTYRVIAFCREVGRFFVQIYHSELAAWSTQQMNAVTERFDSLRSPAYLNGVLYMMACYTDRSPVAFDIEAGTWEKFTLSYSDLINEEISRESLVICDSELMVVRGFGSAKQKEFHVLKVDPESLQLSTVAGRPPAARTLSLARCSTGPNAKFGQEPVSDSSRIFLGMDKLSMVEYDVYENKWSRYKFPATNPPERFDDWVNSCLQPGLNPFVAV